MRLCIVTTFYPPYNFGGDGIYAHRLANGLAQRGHEVTVLHSPSAYEALAGGSPTDGYADHANVDVQPIRTPLGKLGLLLVQQLGHAASQTRSLAQHLDNGRHDVIHYNNVSLLGGPAVFARGTGLKLCTLIEHWLVCPMHVLWKFDREVCTKPTCFTCTLAGGRPPQLWRKTGLMRRATRHIDAFLGPSVFTIRMHQERGLRGAMVQLPLFYPEPTAAEGWDNGGRPYFLFSGRLEKIKGLHTVIPFFGARPEIDLLIAGSGTFEPELRALAEGASNIRFVGRLSAESLHATYRGAIATLVPSLCYETFGLVVAESFAASTPVIVYAQSSLEEIVATHGGGLMYRDLEGLRAAVEALATDPALRARLGREGRQAYEAEFAGEAFLTHYLDVVEELLRRRRSGQARPDIGETTLAGRRLFVTGDN